MSLKKFLSHHPYLFLIVFIEGGVVMAVELMSGHILSAYYGSSIYLWSGILGASLAGLAAGYFAGSWSSMQISLKKLYFISAGISILTAAVPFIAGGLVPATLSLELRTGIMISCLLVIFPSLFLCGMVSPMVIRLVTDSGIHTGRNAGTVFAVSTAGGIVFTFVTGFVLIPYTGIKLGLLLMAFFMLASVIAPLALKTLRPAAKPVKAN